MDGSSNGDDHIDDNVFKAMTLNSNVDETTGTPTRKSISSIPGSVSKDSKDILAKDWGQFGHLTEAQEVMLREFMAEADKVQLEAARYSVETVEQVSLRYLRARRFDKAKSLALLSECYQKMIELGAAEAAQLSGDENAQCDVEALQNYYPHTIYGFDRLGRPVLFEHTGGMVPNAIMQMTTKRFMVNYHWWTMETVLDEKFKEALKIKMAKEGITDPSEARLDNFGTCAVLDMKGFGMIHVCQKMMDQCKTLVGIDNICYPEMLGKMLVINAPWLVLQTWNIVKGWLDIRTQEKITILGSGPDMISKLLEVIPPETLPLEYGGTGPNLFSRKDNVDYVTIPRGGSLKKSFTVQPGHGCHIDSYAFDGNIDILVEVSSAGSTKELSRKTITITEKDIRERLLLTYPATSEQQTFHVTWTSPSRFNTRQLAYVFTQK